MRIGNWPLIFQALEFIIENPDRHRQHTWRSDCGTYRCIAGWIAHFGGWRDVFNGDLDDGLSFVGLNLSGSSDKEVFSVQYAAFQSIKLDPEFYGDYSAYHRLSDQLFSAFRTWPEILATVLDLMRTDEVTPTPPIQAEMKKVGVL